MGKHKFPLANYEKQLKGALLHLSNHSVSLLPKTYILGLGSRRQQRLQRSLKAETNLITEGPVTEPHPLQRANTLLGPGPVFSMEVRPAGQQPHRSESRAQGWEQERPSPWSGIH